MAMAEGVGIYATLIFMDMHERGGRFTSRKHGKKELQSFFHCGFFDHHALRSLNNYIFVFFTYQQTLEVNRELVVNLFCLQNLPYLVNFRCLCWRSCGSLNKEHSKSVH